MFGGTWISHQGVRGDKESHVLELPPGQLKGSAKKHGTRHSHPGALLSVSKLFLNSCFALLTLISASLFLGAGNTEAANQHVTQSSDGAGGDTTGFRSVRDAAWGCGTCSSLSWGFLTAIPAALCSQQTGPFPGNGPFSSNAGPSEPLRGTEQAVGGTRTDPRRQQLAPAPRYFTGGDCPARLLRSPL